MELDECIDQLLPNALTVCLGIKLRRKLLSDHHPLNSLHEVERYANNGEVFAGNHWARHPNPSRGESRQDSIFAEHIMSGRQDIPARWATHHPLFRAPGHIECFIRETSFMLRNRQ